MPTTRRRTRRAKRQQTNPLFAGLGFLVFLAALIYATVVVAQFQGAKRETENNYRKSRSGIVEEGEVERHMLLAQRDEWVAKLKKIQAENLEAKQKIQAAELGVRKGEEELGAREAEQTQAAKQVGAQVADQELVGESVDELKTRANKLRRKRDALRKKFEEAYLELKGELRELVTQNDPDRVKQFFYSNRETAVGPAAAFFAADMYYEKKQGKTAVRLYEDLVKQFPDSPYTAKAEKRLSDIKLRYPYDMYDKAKFHPYKIPDSLDAGAW